MADDPFPCPRCGSAATVPIAYGYPSSEMFEAADRHQIRLGGCVITGDDPDRSCTDCGHTWIAGGDLHEGDRKSKSDSDT